MVETHGNDYVFTKIQGVYHFDDRINYVRLGYTPKSAYAEQYEASLPRQQATKPEIEKIVISERMKAAFLGIWIICIGGGMVGLLLFKAFWPWVAPLFR